MITPGRRASATRSAIMKHRLKSVLLLIIGISVGLFLVFCRDTHKGWITISPTDGNFCVKMPAAPAKTEELLTTLYGQLVQTTYSASTNGIGYLVAYTDFPDKAIRENSPDKAIDSCLAGLMSKNKQARLVHLRTIECSGFIGKDFVIAHAPTDDATTYGRGFLANHRLFYVQAVKTSLLWGHGNAAYFLNSFEIVQSK